MNKIITLSICLLILCTSCGTKLGSANDSIVGIWQVKEIFKHNLFNGNSEEDKSGNGTFEFTKEQCDYMYTFNSINMNNIFSYELQVSRENVGFTNADKFEIIGEENYRIRFGDQTSDAHKDATEMTLETTIINDSVSYILLIELEKK